MASSYSITIPLPAITAAGTLILFRAPSDAHGGGLTIRESRITCASGTLATAMIADTGSAGTSTPGTINTFTLSSSSAANLAGTPNGYFLDGGNFLSFVNGAGTIVTGFLQLTLSPGR